MGEFTALPQTPLAGLRALLLKGERRAVSVEEGKRRRGEGVEGPPLLRIFVDPPLYILC